MKQYTTDEKVKHYEKTPMYENGKYNNYWEFGSGYNMAVTIYRSYVKMDKQSRKVADEIIARNKYLAKQGDEGGKGFMCGMRDAAKDRKEKQAKRNH